MTELPSKAPLLPYPQALLRLLEVTSSPRFGLQRMERLLAGLEKPHHRFAALHVAGTNGKGSVCAFLDALLAGAEISRGLTTSPHLCSCTERIRVQGQPIERGDFCALEQRVHARVQDMRDDSPTFFERVLAMALTAFAQAQAQYAVVEVGMGGRLDGTNVVKPAAVGISRLALDHAQWLGGDLASIAEEKAGIFKKGVPAFSVEQEPAAETVLKEHAKKIDCPLTFVSPLPVDVKLGLAGDFQSENAALALAMFQAALPTNISADQARNHAALASTHWPARLELVQDHPSVLVDGAHNANAAHALGRFLHAQTGPIWLVTGATAGHSVAEFAKALLAEVSIAQCWTVQAQAPRSLLAAEVAAGWKEAGQAALLQPNATVSESLQRAMKTAEEKGGTVVVTGSLYLCGEVRSLLVPMPMDPVLPTF